MMDHIFEATSVAISTDKQLDARLWFQISRIYRQLI